MSSLGAGAGVSGGIQCVQGDFTAALVFNLRQVSKNSSIMMHHDATNIIKLTVKKFIF